MAASASATTNSTTSGRFMSSSWPFFHRACMPTEIRNTSGSVGITNTS